MRVKRTKHEQKLKSWRRALSSKELQMLVSSKEVQVLHDVRIKFNQIVMKKNIRIKAATTAIK
jgi:hypothetical protein